MTTTLGEADHGSGDGFGGHGSPGAEESDGIEGLEDGDTDSFAEAVVPLADEGWRTEDEAAFEANLLNGFVQFAFHAGIEDLGFGIGPNGGDKHISGHTIGFGSLCCLVLVCVVYSPLSLLTACGLDSSTHARKQDIALELIGPSFRMVEVDDMCDQLGRRNLDFAAYEDIDTLHLAVFNELLDQVFSDCAGGADNEGFHNSNSLNLQR